MQLAKLLKLLTFLAVLAIVVTASAQQIRFEDFSVRTLLRPDSPTNRQSRHME